MKENTNRINTNINRIHRFLSCRRPGASGGQGLDAGAGAGRCATPRALAENRHRGIIRRDVHMRIPARQPGAAPRAPARTRAPAGIALCIAAWRRASHTTSGRCVCTYLTCAQS